MGKFKGFRATLEDLLNLRDTKVQEEISYIDAADVSKSIPFRYLPSFLFFDAEKELSAVIGSPINVVIDWNDIITNAEFKSGRPHYFVCCLGYSSN